MSQQVEFWIQELQKESGLHINQLLSLLKISKSTYYRILSGSQVSEETKYKVFKRYLKLLATQD